mgnify:CR=1 FL=1
MRRWKQVLLPVLCAALLLGLLVPASGAVGNVNLMAVNERVLMDLTVENMPRTVNGVLYVPYTMLSNQVNGFSLGVSALYSNTRRTVLVTDGGQKGVIFDTQANTAMDLEGNSAPVRAMVRNSTVFLPIDWLCEYFGTINCTRTQTPYGTLIRVTSASAILSDQDFADAAANNLASARNRYLESGGLGEGVDAVPSGEVEPSEPLSGAELYLAFRWGEEAGECARLVEGGEQRALFLFALEEIAGQDDLVRRLVGAGHTLGLVLDGETVEDCLAQGAAGRRLLAVAARYNALVVSAPNLDEAGRRALAGEGYVVWTATTLGEDFSTGSAMVRGLDSHRVNFVEIACGSGGSAFLRDALGAMEEGNCQVYQGTAPALA